MEKWEDKQNYCKDCDRSIYAEFPSCDINIADNGIYNRPGKCYCKIVNGKMAEKYPWERSDNG